MTLIKIVANLFQKFGYRINPIWREEGLLLEQHLVELFDHYRITTVFDVGANAGQYRDFLRQRVGFSGTIHSFEPQPSLASSLRERARSDPEWHIHMLGLGSSNGELSFNVMARDTFSSFRRPDASAPEKFHGSTTVVNTINVPVRRLDDLLSDLGSPDVESCYLKVDTQGYDLEVIRGADLLLQKVKAMQFELAIQRIYADVPHHLEMLKIVEELNFDISGLFPISKDEHLRAIEFDCVMVRRPCGLNGTSRSFP